MSAFMNSTDMGTTVDLVGVCAGMAAQENSKAVFNSFSVRATAFDCWGLLASTLPDASISDGPISELVLPLIKRALDATDPDLRAAAGCTVALIHEARLNLGMQDGEEVRDEETS